MFGKFFKTAKGSATRITDFDDGVDGQEIVVRLDANTTITHNALLIDCDNDTDITGEAGGIVSFRSVSGVWCEQWLSF